MKMYYAGNYGTRAEAEAAMERRRLVGFTKMRIVERSDGRFDLFYL